MDTSDRGRCGTIWLASAVTKLRPNPLPRAPSGPAPALTFPQGLGGAQKGQAPGAARKVPPRPLHLCHRMGSRGQERGISPGCLRLGFGENYGGKAFSKGRSVIIITRGPLPRSPKEVLGGEGEGPKVILNTLNVGNRALRIPLEISSVHRPPSPLKSGN